MDLFRTSRGRMLLLGVVALVAVAITVPALAQNATETDAPGALSAEGDLPRAERFAEARSAFVEALAEELDLPVDRVDDALTAVRGRLHQERRDDRRAALEERLDAAVADGELTREQADAILDAVEAGVLGGDRARAFRGFGHRGHGDWFGGDGPPPVDGPEGTATGDGA